MPNSAEMKSACAMVSPFATHLALPLRIMFTDPWQRSPRRGKRAIAFRQPDPLLHRAMILFHRNRNRAEETCLG